MCVSSRNHFVLALAAFSVLITLTETAEALDFTPTDLEWATWPEYCRARYVESGAGRTSGFVSKMPAQIVREQKKSMGSGWAWLHHYCAALVYVRRANSPPDHRSSDYWLEEAQRNFQGYLERVDRGHPMFVQVAVELSQVYRKRNQSKAALDLLESAMQLQPAASSLYALEAMIHRDEGRLDESAAVLEHGIRAVDGQSAELHYFLGLVRLEQGDVDAAERHAKRAYELGYPLPGLASKLRRLGRSVN